MAHPRFSRTVWMLAAVLTFTGPAVRAFQIVETPEPGSCRLSLQTADHSWRGQCGPVFGNKEATTLSAREVKSLPGGAGRAGVRPNLMLVGELPLPLMGTSDIELEFFGNGGVIRTEADWRPVILMKKSATTLRFRVLEDVPVEPTDLDRKIVERAGEILASEAVWNRSDNRECAPGDKTWSIYCAFQRASREVSGGFHHRRPSLQIIRTMLYERVAEERKKGRKYPHILEDYNNDAMTTFADVRSLFTEAAARIKR